MNQLCKYKDIFGKSGEGAHKYRIFNIAIVDTVLTIILAIALALLFKINFFLILIILFLLGIILHKLFCVETTVGKFVFN